MAKAATITAISATRMVRRSTARTWFLSCSTREIFRGTWLNDTGANGSRSSMRSATRW